jgi:hypothetical protein
MKYDIQKLREQYAEALEKAFQNKTLTITNATDTLDTLIDSIFSSQERLIDRITQNESFVHHCYGKTLTLPFESYKEKGSFNAHSNFKIEYPGILYNDERINLPRETVWAGTELHDEQNFIARVFGRKIGDSHVFEMHYLDRTHDIRAGSTATYTLLVPKNEIQKVVPEISNNPELLIDLFRKTYKGHDNSEKNGKTQITIDVDKSIFRNVP